MSNVLYAGVDELHRPSGNLGVRDEEAAWGAFRKDYARLLHAPSFRRLQGKTQLFPGGESDFFRNRLTHSLEVAQIARGIASSLNAGAVPSAFGRAAMIDESLVEFAGIAHDLGHPPFGHNGEHALDELMLDQGGFEGNAQTLRILAAVEGKLVQKEKNVVAADWGLDLTYRSLASVLKYDSRIPMERSPRSKLAKGYYCSEADLVSEIKRRVAPRLGAGSAFKTIECAIMDIADDISYSTYDLEDSLHAGFYSPLSLFNEIANNDDVCFEVITKTNQALAYNGYPLIEGKFEIFDVLNETFGLVHSPKRPEGRDEIPSKYLMMFDAVDLHCRDSDLTKNGLLRSRFTAERVGRLINAVELVVNEEFPQLSGVRLGRGELLQVEVLKHLNFEVVIRSPRLSVVEHRGKDIVKGIFSAVMNSRGELLPEDWRRIYAAADSAGKGGVRRVVCDFIACMTDRYAFELYGRLFGEDSTIFKPF
ncbi:deoxyguanosinetriphosphate triphosphohydrolase family protein [Stenotrophomonas maltophilia]|uniref:deoxyguanosinetriphosphate triphosphohydrolase family protein n=1 Tax=Stenotrophomonas maltophilia TaxID=40324 RepID=UPI000DA2ECDE|nr:dNTP triphosphohydrolase [Stenotrophomonas maltophilia]SQG08964.1 Deoxyguanosinetriphosphate triphosphohydrolase [Stenotrophomonas maltophilia]